MAIRVVRLGSARNPGEGLRIGTVRRPPRGVPKSDFVPGAREVIGGYWMIRVKSKEEAIKWASRCPASDNEVIEVRQVQEISNLPAEVQEIERRRSRAVQG